MTPTAPTPSPDPGTGIGPGTGPGTDGTGPVAGQRVEPPPHADRFASQEQVLRLAWGYMSSDLLDLTLRLRLPDLVGDQTVSSTRLAEATDAHPLSVLRLLRALAALGVTAEEEAGTFRLTDVGHRLRSDAPDSLRHFSHLGTGLFRSAFAGLEHSVRTGEPAFDRLYGTDFFSHLTSRPELSAAFSSSMRESTHSFADAFATGYDTAGHRTVVDVGGADGSLLARLLSEHPHLHGVLHDSAEGAADAPDVLRRAAVADRCEVRTGDFFRYVPAGGDLYVLKSVLHDWSDEHATRILRACRAAMASGTTLLVVEVLLPDRVDDSAHPLAYLSDLSMLVTMGGRERGAADFGALLDGAGFRLRQVTSDPRFTPFSLLEAEPVPGAVPGAVPEPVPGQVPGPGQEEGR